MRIGKINKNQNLISLCMISDFILFELRIRIHNISEHFLTAILKSYNYSSSDDIPYNFSIC